MPVPLGYKAKIGWAQESSWGTVATGPFTGVPFFSESLRPNINRVRADIINSFRGKLSLESPISNASVSGDIEVPFYDVRPAKTTDILTTTLALPLWYAFGNYSYTADASDNVTTLTFDTKEFSPENPALQGITFVVDRNTQDASGSSNYFQYVGCKVNELTITGEENGFVRLRFGIVGQLEQITTTTPTITMASGLSPYKFWFSVIQLSDGSYTPVKCRSFEITINNNYNTDRFFNNVHPSYPFAVLADLVPGEREITGNVEIMFDSTKWYERLLNDQSIGINIQLAASRIGTGTPIAELSIPKAVITGEPPNVSGRGPINLRLNFQAVTDSPSTPEISLTFKTS